MDFSRIIAHPDKEDIIGKLVSGIKPKDIADWLKLKYPDKNQSHLRLPSSILKEFIDNNIDLYDTLKQDVANIKDGKKIDKKIAESLSNNKTYRERLNEIADKEIDVRTIIKETGFIIQQRIEQYFDRMQENPSNQKPDYGLIKWFEVLLKWSEVFYKIVEEGPDQRVEHNITLQVIDQYTIIFQEALREVVADMSPEMASQFMENLNSKLQKLKPPSEDTKELSLEEKIQQANTLSSSLKKEEVVAGEFEYE